MSMQAGQEVRVQVGGLGAMEGGTSSQGPSRGRGGAGGGMEHRFPAATLSVPTSSLRSPGGPEVLAAACPLAELSSLHLWRAQATERHEA